MIFCNDRLYYWKIVKSQQCEFCNYDKQNVLHLLWECPMTRDIWKEFKKFIDNAMPIEQPIILNPSTIILNSIHTDPMHLFNLMALIIKQHIYAMKCFGSRPTFQSVLVKIEQTFQMERYNAYMKGVYKKHNKKWSIYHKNPQSTTHNK